jgi:hypothetical protein
MHAACTADAHRSELFLISALDFVTRANLKANLVASGYAAYSVSYGKILNQWRYGATVSTRPFQGRNTGSIPVSATKNLPG